MKHTLVCILALCLVNAWGESAVRADGATPPAAAPALSDPVWAGGVQATLAPGGDGDLADHYPFAAGTRTFEFLTGYFAPTRVGPHGPHLDYIPQTLRAGVICNDPHPDCPWFSGSFEVLLEYNCSPIVSEHGNYFTGPNAILRYNWVFPQCAVVPYLQGGAGFFFNDAYRDPILQEKLIGEAFEFLLRTEVGAHVMVTENVAVDVEGGFQHISNAGLSSHNGGANSLGIMLGVTYYFHK